MKIILFDVDGTILLSGGAGLKAMNDVFREHYDVKDAFKGIDPGGMTDPGIFRQIYQNHGLPEDHLEDKLNQLKELYIERLGQYMPDSPSVLMPGFPEILETLSKTDGVLLGLLTGNFKRGAKIKLEKHGLNGFFAFGAFGSDAEDRNSLVPFAIERAARHVGGPVAVGRNVVIVGDTIRDIECGRVNGCSTVAVATGNSSREDLKKHKPDALFEDFSDVQSVVERISQL